MPRYKLRTLLIVLALGPPLLATAWIFWDITLGVFVVLAIPIVFAGAVIVLGSAVAIPFIVAIQLTTDLCRLFAKKRDTRDH